MAQTTTTQGLGESLFSLIRKIDNAANIFIGEVLSIDVEGRTCIIKEITGVANDGVDETGLTNQTYIDYINTPMVHEDVALMSGGNIDDGFLLIPKVGSQVTCMVTKTQQTFIIQYTALDNVYITPSKQYEIHVNKNTLVVAESSIDLKVNNGAEIIANTDVDLKAKDGGEVKIDSKFDIKSANGANINGDTKITIKNNADSLVNILGDLMTALQSITVTCASPGSPSTPPINLAQFVLLNTRIQNLLQ